MLGREWIPRPGSGSARRQGPRCEEAHSPDCDRRRTLPQPPQPENDAQAARLRSYETLIDVSRMLLGSASLEELFYRVTTELRRLVGYDAVTIYGVD